MIQLLANLSSTPLGESVKTISSIKLNFIGELIRILIEGIGIVGVGIIVFTLILKTIVLPLDIYSRIKTKKQALIMEKMRPQMEKLQKQYANDKNMYSQKVMELQKKNGYSMFGACLPMIVSLVIFIVVFQAFSTYSQYANLESYNGMVKAYNGVVETYVIEEDETTSEDSDIKFLKKVEVTNDKGKVTAVEYYVDFDNFVARCKAENDSYAEMSDTEVFKALLTECAKTNSAVASADLDILDKDATSSANIADAQETLKISAVSYYISTPAAKAAENYYLSNDNHFLWVKNIWYPDSVLNREVPTFSKFKSTVTKASISSSYEEDYNKVTANLTQQKEQYNGYFILIALSIGFMLLQQFISMKANKSVNELGTVDGSGAKTNKYMLIMMPIIYGIFSFFYSAAFSIYMITNTVYSIITTLIINKSLDVWFAKREAAAEFEKYDRKPNKKKK